AAPPGWVTAPSRADPTCWAYFHKYPEVNVGGRGFHALARAASSALLSLTSSVPLTASMAMMSPSRTTAIGPPTAASGPTSPLQKPPLAPEHRPPALH